MSIRKFTTEVYSRQAFIYCNEHGTKLCFCFENITWEHDVRSPDRPCPCLIKEKPRAKLYFINRYENKNFD